MLLWLLMCILDFFLPLTTEPEVVRQKAANCKYYSEYEMESLAIYLINYIDFFTEITTEMYTLKSTISLQIFCS